MRSTAVSSVWESESSELAAPVTCSTARIRSSSSESSSRCAPWRSACAERAANEASVASSSGDGTCPPPKNSCNAPSGGCPSGNAATLRRPAGRRGSDRSAEARPSSGRAASSAAVSSASSGSPRAAASSGATGAPRHNAPAVAPDDLDSDQDGLLGCLPQVAAGRERVPRQAERSPARDRRRERLRSKQPHGQRKLGGGELGERLLALVERRRDPDGLDRPDDLPFGARRGREHARGPYPLRRPPGRLRRALLDQAIGVHRRPGELCRQRGAGRRDGARGEQRVRVAQAHDNRIGPQDRPDGARQQVEGVAEVVERRDSGGRLGQLRNGGSGAFGNHSDPDFAWGLDAGWGASPQMGIEPLVWAGARASTQGCSDAS